jgi:hypothetical protein
VLCGSGGPCTHLGTEGLLWDGVRCLLEGVRGQTAVKGLGDALGVGLRFWSSFGSFVPSRGLRIDSRRDRSFG